VKAGLILPPPADPWRDDAVRQAFGAIAQALTAAGWTAELIDAAEAAEAGVPLLAAAEAASDTQTLRDGYALAARLRRTEFDVLLAPLGGGILQPLLMARATGEALAHTAVLLWCEAPAAWRACNEPACRVRLGTLVDDALERACLRLADGLVASGPSALERVLAIGADAPRARIGVLPGTGRQTGRRWLPADAITDIAFIGPATSGSGLPHFLDAIEALDRSGVLGTRRVSFLGPMRDDAPGLSKTLLGIRAQAWTFDFRVEDAPTQSAVAGLLGGAGVLPVFGCGEACDVLRTQLAFAGVPAAWAAEPGDFLPLLRHALSLGAGVLAAPEQTTWPALLQEAAAQRRPFPRRPEPSASVCIVHQNRPHCRIGRTAWNARSAASRPRRNRTRILAWPTMCWSSTMQAATRRPARIWTVSRRTRAEAVPLVGCGCSGWSSQCCKRRRTTWRRSKPRARPLSSSTTTTSSRPADFPGSCTRSRPALSTSS